jgi:DNA polymerase-3 subunit epsilon
MLYAIVDIETTGGSSKSHKITEIAVIIHDGEREISRYETLVNPEMHIPRNITALTGITNELVETAPVFKEVAEELHELLKDKVFVAHNVNFDYGFIRAHFADVGVKWNPKRLCTVRLSRKIIPGLYSYSLGKIAQQLCYQIEHRHRAMGDCDFTAILFKKLHAEDRNEHIKFALNARSREATLPPNLSRTIMEKMPDTLGVYLFYDASGKVIYTGKANNIKHRVSEHFRGNTHTGYISRFAEKIVDVKWIECPNELISLLVEAKEIKKHWPPYNRLMKRVTLNWGVFSYRDQNDYARFSIGRVGKWAKPIVSFRSQFEARQIIMKLRDEFQLCARYCDLQEQSGECAEDVHGTCNKACVQSEAPDIYNKRHALAIEHLTKSDGTLIIRDAGFTPDEETLVLVKNGRYKGHGVIPKSLQVDGVEDVLKYIETGYDDQDIQSIIRSHIHRNKKARVTVLS